MVSIVYKIISHNCRYCENGDAITTTMLAAMMTDSFDSWTFFATIRLSSHEKLCSTGENRLLHTETGRQTPSLCQSLRRFLFSSNTGTHAPPLISHQHPVLSSARDFIWSS
jgi:hypothetical protein